MSLDGRFEPQVAKQISQPGEPPRRMASGRLDPRGTSRRTAWLLDPVSNVSAPVHAALIGDLDLSPAGIAASLLNFFLLNGICCLLSREPLFFGFLAGNFFLSGLRLAALLLVRKGDAAKQLWRTDFYVFITLVWCLFEGALTGAALLFSNAPMEVLGTAGAASSARGAEFSGATLCHGDHPLP